MAGHRYNVAILKYKTLPPGGTVACAVEIGQYPGATGRN
jgi:hypothetical protein